MAVDLPLAQMSLEDKLQAMEMLWADLSESPSEFVAPHWHSEVLQRRRDQVDQGTASFQDWESAIGRF